MFNSPNIWMLFKKADLRKDKEGHPYARATFILDPLPAALAHEMGEDVAAHLFDAGDFVREELTDITLKPPVVSQILTVRAAPDAPEIVRLNPVTIEAIKVSKQEDEEDGKVWLAMQVTLSYSLSERKAREFTIDQFGNVLSASFEALQRGLLDGQVTTLEQVTERLIHSVTPGERRRDDEDPVALARVKEAAARMVGKGEIESVTIITPDGESIALTKDDGKRLRQEARDLRAQAAAD